MSLLGAVFALLAVLSWPSASSRRAGAALVRRGGSGGAPPTGVPGAARTSGLRPVARTRDLRGPPTSGTGQGAAGWVAAGHLLRQVGDRLPGQRGSRSTGEGAGALLPLLDGLAGALRAGLPPGEALDLVCEGLPDRVRGLVAPVGVSAAEGSPCAPAWDRAAREGGSPDLALLARSWAVSERLGAPLADAVDSTARGLRSRRDLAARMDAATAGARATVTILMALPVAGIGIAALLGIGPAELYGSPVAVASLALGCVLLALGRVVVNRMISRVQELA